MLSELERGADIGPGVEMIEVTAPFTGEVVARVPQATPDHVASAAAKARAGQPEWERMGVKRRAAIMLRFHDLVLKHTDEITDLIQLEGGKARLDAWREVVDTVGWARYCASVTERLTRTRRRQGAMPLVTRTFEHRPARGLVGFIVPWNYPFNLGMTDAMSALVTGNAVLIKPDEKTPLSTLYGARLLEEAGVPGGVVQVLTGRGEPIGEAMVERVDYIMFTGSTEVGRLIAGMAGRRLIDYSLELGGKNTAIVLADSDLDRIVPLLAEACFANGGQTCVAMERVMVEEPIRQELTRRLVQRVEAMAIEPGYDYRGEVSCLIDTAQLARVAAHVEDAVAKGATLLTGGKPRPDLGPTFYAPTLLGGVTPDMALYAEETFGPVTAIYGFHDVEEAIAFANGTDYGLHFSVWTGDTGRGRDIARRLRAGSVTINDGLVASWGSHDAPMGGMKSSGIGRRHGGDGILKFTEPQTVAVQRLIPAYAPFGPVTPPRLVRLVALAARLFRRLPFYR